MDDTPDNSQPAAEADVHHKIGLLTRQLHDSLNELGYADKLRGSMGELPDAQSRLSKAGFETDVSGQSFLDELFGGSYRVVGQSPGPTVFLRRGSTVHLDVEAS